MNVFGHHLSDKEIGMLIGAIGISLWVLKWIFKIFWYALLGFLGVKIYKDITRN